MTRQLRHFCFFIHFGALKAHIEHNLPPTPHEPIRVLAMEL